MTGIYFKRGRQCEDREKGAVYKPADVLKAIIPSESTNSANPLIWDF